VNNLDSGDWNVNSCFENISRILCFWLADYNINARILANRLKMTINDVLYDTQYSAVTGRNILDGTAALRDIIAAGTRTNRGIC
jgi:hypothetical protein